MRTRIYLLLACVALTVQSRATAAGSFNSNHPEEGYPDDMPAVTSGGAFADLLAEVQ